MRKVFLAVSAFVLAGCAGYSRQVVQLHLNKGDASQSTTIGGKPSVRVASTTNTIPLQGIAPNAIFELEPNPPLADFLTARLGLMVGTTGVSADCTVSAVGADVRNNLTKGSMATDLTLQCNVSGPHGSTSHVYVGRDVRTLHAGWSGIDYKAELQPGLEACLQKIAPALQRDMISAGAGV